MKLKNTSTNNLMNNITDMQLQISPFMRKAKKKVKVCLAESTNLVEVFLHRRVVTGVIALQHKTTRS